MIELLRVLTVLVALGVLVVLVVRRTRWLCRKPGCLVGPALVALLALVMAYGAVEAMLRDLPGGPRTVLYLVGECAVLVQALRLSDRASCRA